MQLLRHSALAQDAQVTLRSPYADLQVVNKPGTYGAFPPQVPEQALVLLRGQEQGANVSDSAGRRVAVHGSGLLNTPETMR